MTGDRRDAKIIMALQMMSNSSWITCYTVGCNGARGEWDRDIRLVTSTFVICYCHSSLVKASLKLSRQYGQCVSSRVTRRVCGLCTSSSVPQLLHPRQSSHTHTQPKIVFVEVTYLYTRPPKPTIIITKEPSSTKTRQRIINGKE